MFGYQVTRSKTKDEKVLPAIGILHIITKSNQKYS